MFLSGFRHEPDFDGRLRPVLLRQGLPDRVPFYELFADIEIIEAVVGRPLAGQAERIEFQMRLGYDFVTVWLKGFDLPTEGKGVDALSGRTYNTASQGTIRSWEDFERYPWPRREDIDFSPVEEAARLMPRGMKGIVLMGHQLESPLNLMGYEALSYALVDDPKLVRAVFDRIGELELYCYECCSQMEAVGAVLISDDLGFKTGTLISPAALREHVFPWYSRFAAAAHAGDKPVILHSCGKLDEVMDDIIACGIDAKHSYEDQITPVEEFKRRYGDRIAVLGGMDMDFICRSGIEEIKKRTRHILKSCMPGGGYALGTGNTVASYVPVQNYLAMLEEGLAVGRY